MQLARSARLLSFAQALDLPPLDRLLDAQDTHRGLFGLGERIDADNQLLSGIYLFLVAHRRAVDFTLRETNLDGPDHTTHLVKLVEIDFSFRFETVCQPFQIIRP